MSNDIVDAHLEGFPYEREARTWRVAEQCHAVLQQLLQHQDDAIQRLDVANASLQQRTADLAALIARVDASREQERPCD